MEEEEETVIQNDFYIKLANEEQMSEVFADFYKQDFTSVIDEETGEETLTPEGDPYLVTHTHDYAIDVIGILQEPTGTMLTDEEGNEYPQMAPIEGWHVNVRLVGDTKREAIEARNTAHGVIPNSPARVWL